MIQRNIDASLGLVNGTIAKVISVVQDTSTDNRKDQTSFTIRFRIFNCKSKC